MRYTAFRNPGRLDQKIIDADEATKDAIAPYTRLINAPLHNAVTSWA